jgi:phage-related tail protein
MDYLAEDDLTQLAALYRDAGSRGLPELVVELGTVVRVLRAVPALVAELQETRAELGRLRQSHQMLRAQLDRTTTQLKTAQRAAKAA